MLDDSGQLEAQAEMLAGGSFTCSHLFSAVNFRFVAKSAGSRRGGSASPLCITLGVMISN